MKLSWLIITLSILILLGFSMQGCVTVEVNSGTYTSEETKDKELNIGIGAFDD